MVDLLRADLALVHQSVILVGIPSCSRLPDYSFIFPERCGKSAERLSSSHSLGFESALAKSAIWVIRAQSSETEPSLPKLEECAKELLNRKILPELAQVFGLCAYIALLKNDPHSAKQYLASAMRIEQDHASLQPLAAEVIHTPLLDAFIMADRTMYKSIVHELERLHTAQRNFGKRIKRIAATISSNNVFTLHVTTLGHESIERDGQVIPERGWKATTVKDLFFYLLMNGSQSREQIAIALWPEDDSSQIRKQFNLDMLRIRRALGENIVKFSKNVYTINQDIDLWCDAQEMESLIQQARLLPMRDARTEALWHKAVDLYQGTFLPALSSTWTAYQRERFQDLHIEALIAFGHCARARGDVRHALHIYKRVLSLKPFQEEVHRAIMGCYFDLGEKAQVREQFERLKRLLREELCIEPSRQTISLAESLLK